MGCRRGGTLGLCWTPSRGQKVLLNDNLLPGTVFRDIPSGLEPVAMWGTTPQDAEDTARSVVARQILSQLRSLLELPLLDFPLLWSPLCKLVRSGIEGCVKAGSSSSLGRKHRDEHLGV